MRTKKVEFTNKNGYALAARLELPIDQHPHNFVLFAHVFTGHKNLNAVKYISRGLTMNGFGVLRFDFTGLGESEGEFAETTFTSNVEDLMAAAQYLETQHRAPAVIVGHSLGGAAALFAASQLRSVKAVATIGTPSEPEHVSHLLRDSIEDIEARGMAKVSIGSNEFMIKKEFLDDLRNQNMFKIIRHLRKALLVLHSPQDRIVEIENAARIYHAAHHPKSYVTLDGADHMLTNRKDATYAGDLIGSWAMRYLDLPQKENLRTKEQVVVRLGEGFTTDIKAGQHPLTADEPETVGGSNLGPSPYEYLSASLGACTAMTLQMYARRKKWDLQEVTVHLSHDKKYLTDCEEFEKPSSKVDHFLRIIQLEGDLTPEQKNRLLEIANKCPVHRTLMEESRVETRLAE
ncbi:MAG: alpha/beta fold hydrolase [Bacteroidota bacterium]